MDALMHDARRLPRATMLPYAFNGIVLSPFFHHHSLLELRQGILHSDQLVVGSSIQQPGCKVGQQLRLHFGKHNRL
jgi:hypothetical protein